MWIFTGTTDAVFLRTTGTTNTNLVYVDCVVLNQCVSVCEFAVADAVGRVVAVALFAELFVVGV